MKVVKVYTKGAWRYTETRSHPQIHKGFWHKLFCTVESFNSIAFRPMSTWDEKIILYKCGHQITIRRERGEE